jgi:hypothetical protein
MTRDEMIAEWGDAAYNARENYTVDPHEHIERLITLGDALAALSTPPVGEAERLREALFLLGETVQDIRRMADAVDRGVATRDGCRAFADRVSAARQRLASPAPQPAAKRCDAFTYDPGLFQCEGKHGHTGPHFWGSLTWPAPAPHQPGEVPPSSTWGDIGPAAPSYKE